MLSLASRCLLAFFTAAGGGLLLGQPMIAVLRFLHWGQRVRQVGPTSHLSKQGTPTMGGIGLLFPVIVSIFLFGQMQTAYLPLIVGVLCAFALLGALDDGLKCFFKSVKGLTAGKKYMLQSLLSVAFCLLLLRESVFTPVLFIPFFHLLWPLQHLAFLLWGYLVLVGSSNAANLTDGLDGLLIVPVMLLAAGLGVLAYHPLPGLGVGSGLSAYREVAVCCAALCGGGAGFLWFNGHPASVFMGDTGALALGAGLGFMALVLGHTVVFALMSLLLVAQTLSVMIQVLSFRFWGRRVFRMAPLHHHFELSGWSESKVVIRFWLVALFCALLGLWGCL